VVGSCEYGNEPLGSIKHMEFLDCLSVSFARTLLHGVRLYKKSEGTQLASEPADNYKFFCGNGNTNYYLGTDFLV
jgi:hypothetical protein